MRERGLTVQDRCKAKALNPDVAVVVAGQYGISLTLDMICICGLYLKFPTPFFFFFFGLTFILVTYLVIFTQINNHKNYKKKKKIVQVYLEKAKK